MVGRSIQFQVAPDQRLKRIASGKEKLNKQTQTEDLITSRGAIVDRNGNDLALSVIVKSFFANPKVIKNPAIAAAQLAPLLGQNIQKLKTLLSQEKFFVWLKREVDDSVAKKIEALNIDGVYSRKESKRIYPHGEVGKSIVGVAGLDGVGLEGIEKKYDSYLLSSDKVGARGIRDALGRLLLFDDFEREWFESHHVVSTLDVRIQRIIEDELYATVREKEALSGEAIMMNPKTGEILAMASVDGKRKDYEPLRNRAVSDVYEPGSTFKVILAAASLEHLGMSADSQIFGENGSFRVGSHVIKEYHNHKYGWLSLQELLEVSSNVASAKLGLKIGAADLEDTIKKFGFGDVTGIDLPGEASGLLRSASNWKPIELANIAFGQGLAVTPLQMVRAVAAVANGGLLVKPYVVSKVLAPKTRAGAPDVVWSAKVESQEILAPDEAKHLTDMLIHVTEPGSTGLQAAIDGYRIAGKTGTSQKLIEKENARGKKYKTYSADHTVVSFVGYVPAYDPAFVLIVMYDDPSGRSSGGMTAAPSFRRMASRSLAVLGVPPERDNPVTIAAVRSKESLTEGNRFVGKSFQEVLKEVKDLPQDQRAKYDLIGFGTAFREETAADQHTKIYFK
ncbi:MAG: Peptidoglycan glycosyltransferase [Bacteriovoracaceae bacterium]|nr:Peptidoglycan glycosyltransferase [Bacteriovoracaceae bacterium]